MRRWGNRYNKNNVSKDEKLKLIHSILNGNFDFEALNKKPKYYHVWACLNEDETEGTYSVTCDTTGDRLEFTSKEKYEEWYATLNDHDNVFTVIFREQRGNDPLIERDELEVDYRPEMAAKIQTQPKEIEPVQSKKKPVKSQVETIQVEQDIFPVIPNHGKLADYGITWKLKNN